MRTLVQRILSNAALWERDLTAVPGLAPAISASLRAIEAGDLLKLLRRNIA